MHKKFKNLRPAKQIAFVGAISPDMSACQGLSQNFLAVGIYNWLVSPSLEPNVTMDYAEPILRRVYRLNFVCRYGWRLE